MSSIKAMKHALVLSVTAIIMSVAMLIGTTFAWFTDTASTSVNKVQSGELNIALEVKDGSGNWVAVGEELLAWKREAGQQSVSWQPGSVHELPELRIVNNGSLAVKYRLAVRGMSGSTDLLNVISFTYGNDDSGYTDIAEQKHLAPGKATESFTVKGTMDANAPIDYQGLSVQGVMLEVIATQDTVEHDSNDNQYDKDARLNAVTLELGYNADFAAANPEIVSAADAMLNSEGYASLAEAHDAFRALFETGKPLSGTTDIAVEKVTYYIEGSVPVYSSTALSEASGSLVLSQGPDYPVSVGLIGLSDAVILGEVNLSANVAGGYDGMFVRKGSFDVRDIEFAATNGNTVIDISGNHNTPGSMIINTVTLNIIGCTFHNTMYVYHNDTATFRNENIINNTFINDGTAKYAYFHQGSDFRGVTNTVTFEGNTVKGYSRGINLQSKNTDFLILNNNIVSTNSEPDRGALQLTDGETFVISGNTVNVSAGNAFYFHSAATNAAVLYTITDNSITAPYLANDDTPFDAATFNINEHITSSGNILSITYTGKCMEKDAAEPSESSVIIN